MTTPKDLMRAKFNEVVAKAKELHPKFAETGIEIDLRFDLRGVSAGRAFVSYTTKEAWVRLNLEAYDADPHEMIEDTIAHEVAHIVAPLVYGKLGRGHSIGWRSLTRALGGHGRRCHNLKLTKARRTRKYVYTLADGERISMSGISHRRLQEGRFAYHSRKSGLKITRELPYEEVME